MRTEFLVRQLALPLLLGLLLAPPVRADTDQDRAREAVQSGQVMPLEKVLARVRQTWPGEVLEVELEQKHGQWVYDIKLLQPDGQLRKLRLDARNAALMQEKLRLRERRGEGAGRHGNGGGQ